MKWICLPQHFRIPYIYELKRGIWYSPDSGLFALVGSSSVVLVEAANFLPHADVDGRPLAMQSSLVNGLPWFRDGERALFYSYVLSTWVLSQDGLRDPVATVDPSTGDEIGCSWHEGSWSFSPWSSSSASVATFLPKGGAVGNVSVAIVWPRWRKLGVSSNDYITPLGGTYFPVDGASGRKSLGVPAWRRGTDNLVFMLRTGGDYVAPATDARIVPASDVWEDDETGDWVFSDHPEFRFIGESPRAGFAARFYTLDASTGVYTQVGRLYNLGNPVVPRIESADGTLPYNLYVATVPQWM